MSEVVWLRPIRVRITRGFFEGQHGRIVGWHPDDGSDRRLRAAIILDGESTPTKLGRHVMEIEPDSTLQKTEGGAA